MSQNVADKPGGSSFGVQHVGVLGSKVLRGCYGFRVRALGVESLIWDLDSARHSVGYPSGSMTRPYHVTWYVVSMNWGL